MGSAVPSKGSSGSAEAVAHDAKVNSAPNTSAVRWRYVDGSRCGDVMKYQPWNGKLRGMISRFCCAAQRKYDSGQQCAGGLGQVQSDRSGLSCLISRRGLGRASASGWRKCQFDRVEVMKDDADVVVILSRVGSAGGEMGEDRTLDFIDGGFAVSSIVLRP